MKTRRLTCTYVKRFDKDGTLTAKQGCSRQPTRARKGKLASLLAIGISLCYLTLPLKTVDSATAYEYPKPSYAIYTINEYHAYALLKLDNDIIQYDCILKLYNEESLWNPNAVNGSHYGIPQGNSKWLVGKSPKIQIDWGIRYIVNRYGNACTALNHWSKYGWH